MANRKDGKAMNDRLNPKRCNSCHGCEKITLHRALRSTCRTDAKHTSRELQHRSRTANHQNGDVKLVATTRRLTSIVLKRSFTTRYLTDNVKSIKTYRTGTIEIRSADRLRPYSEICVRFHTLDKAHVKEHKNRR